LAAAVAVAATAEQATDAARQLPAKVLANVGDFLVELRKDSQNVVNTAVGTDAAGHYVAQSTDFPSDNPHSLSSVLSSAIAVERAAILQSADLFTTARESRDETPPSKFLRRAKVVLVQTAARLPACKHSRICLGYACKPLHCSCACHA
jgi:hypothetical protein